MPKQVASPVEWSYFNTYMCMFESSQMDESRAQSPDSSKQKPTENLELLYILKQSHYVKCPALELLCNTLCGPRT